jgi:hypothetical protein
MNNFLLLLKEINSITYYKNALFRPEHRYNNIKIECKYDDDIRAYCTDYKIMLDPTINRYYSDIKADILLRYLYNNSLLKTFSYFFTNIKFYIKKVALHNIIESYHSTRASYMLTFEQDKSNIITIYQMTPDAYDTKYLIWLYCDDIKYVEALLSHSSINRLKILLKCYNQDTIYNYAWYSVYKLIQDFIWYNSKRYGWITACITS